MYTCSLVLTFRDDPALLKSTLNEIASTSAFTLGESYGLCVAVVLETADANEAHHWHDWVAALPGVEHAEVVFVNWETPESEVAHVGL